jgi:hypothetical protein
VQAADARARSAAESRRRKISPRISSGKIGCDAGAPASGGAAGEDIVWRGDRGRLVEFESPAAKGSRAAESRRLKRSGGSTRGDC